MGTLIAACDLLGGAGGENEFKLPTADADFCTSVVHKNASLHLRECRLIHLGVPAADNRCGNSGGIFGHLCFPRVLALTIQLVASQNGALDGGGGELNALALCGEVRRGDAKLDLIEPEVAVFAVGLFRPESDGHGFTAVLGCGNEHLVVIYFCAGEVLRHLHANIVNTQRQSTALKLLHDLRCAVVGIERRLGQFHRKLCCHGLGKGHDPG